MVGKGVMPGKYGDIQMVDVAPTVAALLGTNIPATNQGHPQIAMLDLTLTQVDQIYSALAIQQDQLVQAYQTAIGRPVTVIQSGDIVSASQAGMNAARDSLLDNQRLPRGIIAIVLAFLFINLAAWHARPYYSWMLVGVVAYLLIFNIKYILIDQKTFSLSSVIDASNLIGSTALTTLIALFVGWLLVLLGVKGYQLRPRKAAALTLKFILTTLSILSIPIFVHYAVNGAIVTWTLPNFLISFLGLLFLVQILIVSMIGLFFTGLSALVGFFGH